MEEPISPRDLFEQMFGAEALIRLDGAIRITPCVARGKKTLCILISETEDGINAFEDVFIKAAIAAAKGLPVKWTPPNPVVYQAIGQN